MDQRLQVRKIINQKIRRDFFESLRRVAVRDSASLDRRVTSGQHIYGGISDHPGPVTITFSVRQNLEYSNRIRFLVIKTIATIYGAELLVDSKPVQHCATKVNRFVCQHRQLAVC